MRELADDDRIRRFMRALGREAGREADAYFTGGATAVLLGWRATTIDVDVTFEPEEDALLRALPRLKEVVAGLVVPEQALAFLREIEPELFRYPAVDPASFRARVEGAFARAR